jgi:small GTP-binding protein
MPKLEKPDIQILIMGSSGVGKSCSMIRFTQDKFINNYIATQGIDFKNKKVTIGNKVINARIWDTAGQERYKTLTTSYIRGADVIIVCYDITDMSSYNELYHWVKTAEHYRAITTPPISDCRFESR